MTQPEPALSWWRQLNILLPLLLGGVFVGLFFYFVYALQYHGNTDKTALGRLLKGEKMTISPLEGLSYPQSVSERHALGVMIENHPDARPQFGLSNASVVYEAMAEGGITRFLAIYGPRLPPKIGPVRSARTYYLDWCLEYDCFYSHVGGNIDALDLIPTLKIKDLDQFHYGVSLYGKTYFRIPRPGIASEHTMFTDPSKLYNIAANNHWLLTGSFPRVSYKSEVAKNSRPIQQQIIIPISSKQFEVIWQYNPVTNDYGRNLAGRSHIDTGSGQQIRSKVIIIQEIKARPIVTKINEQGLAMDTVGSGKITVFQDGQAISGTWSKSSSKERTFFSGMAGSEISFNPGQRWIMIVNPGTAIQVQ